MEILKLKSKIVEEKFSLTGSTGNISRQKKEPVHQTIVQPILPNFRKRKKKKKKYTKPQKPEEYHQVHQQMFNGNHRRRQKRAERIYKEIISKHSKLY